MPGPDRLVGDNAVDAAADLDRPEVRRGARKLRLRGATLRLRLTDASRLGCNTATGGEVGRSLRAQLRGSPVTLKHQACQPLTRVRPCPGERFVASYLVLCRCGGSLGARDLGGRLGDRGLLLIKCPARSGDVGAGCGDLGLRLFDIGAVVARIEHGEQLTATDRLVVGDENTLDIAAHLRRDGHEVRAHIGVVGRLQELAARAIIHVPNDSRDDAGDKRGDEDVANDGVALEKRRLLFAILLLGTVLRPGFWVKIRVRVLMSHFVFVVLSPIVSHPAVPSNVNRTVA